jgi:hypothetical protein
MRESSVTKMEVDPFLVSVPQAGQMIGRGVSKIYELLGSGELRAVKSDGRTLVVVESLRKYVSELPNAIVAPRERRKPQHLRETAASVR